MSSRRSGRTTHPHPTTLSHSNSGASTSSSRRDNAGTERHTRSKPVKSPSPRFYSSDEIDDGIATVGSIVPEVRRSTRRGQASRGDEDDDTKEDDDIADEQGDADEEETTRCICGYLEYQGPPELPRPSSGTSRHGKTGKTGDAAPEEAGSLFIQCDTCKVWQHGGCVGIMDEAASPDEYFCEMCRRDLHKVMTSLSGQKYSRYLPVYEQTHGKSYSRKTSVTKESDPRSAREKSRQAKANASDSFTKRRSTMNSRAAFEEEEMVRKAIEESKAEGAPTVVGSVSTAGRKGKRSREESEDAKPDIKRQRTQSDDFPPFSPSPHNSEGSALESDVEEPPSQSRSRSNTDNGSSAKKSSRTTTAKSHKEKEHKEPSFREEIAKTSTRNGRLKRGEGKPTSAGAQYRDIYLMVSPADPERDAADLELQANTAERISRSNEASQQQTPEVADEVHNSSDSPVPSGTADAAGEAAPAVSRSHHKKGSISNLSDLKAKIGKSKKGRNNHGSISARDQPTPPINVGSPKRPHSSRNDSSSPQLTNGSTKEAEASRSGDSEKSSTTGNELNTTSQVTSQPTSKKDTSSDTKPTPTPTTAPPPTSTATTTTFRKPPKPPSTRFDKTSWTDMRRMLNYMQEYISRWEVEIASPHNQALNESLLAQGIQPKGTGEAFVSSEELEGLDRIFEEYKAGMGMEAELVKRFRRLNTVQMRVVLQRRMGRLKEEFTQFE